MLHAAAAEQEVRAGGGEGPGEPQARAAPASATEHGEPQPPLDTEMAAQPVQASVDAAMGAPPLQPAGDAAVAAQPLAAGLELDSEGAGAWDAGGAGPGNRLLVPDDPML